MFVLELLVLGGFAILKILFSTNPNGGKWSTLFIFLLCYPIAYIFIFILLGNFFNAGDQQMNYTLKNQSIYILLGIYTFNFVYFYLIKGEFRFTTAKKVSENTFLKMMAIFIILLVILLPFSFLVSAGYLSILMAVAILICRLIIDNFIDKRLQKSASYSTTS